jgi:thymidylate synthase
MTKFDEIYQSLLKKIMEEGIEETNQRTGHKTKAIPGLTFSMDIEKDGFPLLTLRKTPIKLFIAEQCWFLSAGRKPEDFLRDFTKIWDLFTNPGDVVTVAYGYRWRKQFGRDQIGLLIKLLEKDPSSRHGVVITWDPSSDGLGGVAKKNVPCPYTFTVNIIGGKLHFHNIIRSNDMILGMPADTAGFVFLQCLLAQRLGVKPGIYTHSISNAHIYDIHYHAAEELISRRNEHKKIVLHLPPNSFERAEKKDKDFVEEVAKDFLSQYNPMEQIKNIPIVE